MLRIYSVALAVVSDVGRALPSIAQKDADLAKQLRRAAASITLNMAEGMYSRGGTRQARYLSSMGSARETLSCFETAVALGYLNDVDPNLHARMDHVIGTLYKLTR